MAKKVAFELTVDARGAVEGVKRADSSIKDLDKSLKSVEKDAQKVGKAKADMGKASAEASNLMSQGLKAVGIDTTRFTTAMRTADTVKKATTVSTKALSIALLALPFVAIAAAALVLVRAFTSTQEGADKLNKIIEPLRFTMQALWGVVQDFSTGLFTRVFEDPKQAIIDLGQLILDNILNRFRAIPLALKAVSDAFTALKDRDIEGLRQAGRDMGDALIQATTGVADATQKASDAFNNLRDTVNESIESGGRLAELRVQIEELSNAQILSLAQLRREYNEILNASRDQTKSEQERLEALQQSQVLAARLRDEQLALLNLQIEEAQLRAKANDTSREAQGEINRLIAQRDELESQYQATIRRTNTELTRIQSQQAEAFEARQQQVIDEFDAIMANFDAQEARENELYENRLALMEQEKQERLEMIRNEQEAREEAIQKQIEAEARLLGNALANDLRRATSIEDLGRRALQTALNEILLRTFASVVASVPFPANVFLAPIAAAGASRAAQALVPGFRDGGLVTGGRKIIEVNETGGSEFVVNAEATRRNLPLLEAINRGGGLSGVSAQGGNLNQNASNQTQEINVIVDLDDTINKVNDRNSINVQRNITTV